MVLPFLPQAVSTATYPKLEFDRPSVQAKLGSAFIGAVDNLLRINTVPFDAGRYNSTGLLTGRFFIRAGGGYDEPWTRDASINSWNAASLLVPEIARNTLWAATRRDEQGRPIVQRDNQWWDKGIWIVAAWNHYRTTGDRKFLTTALGVAERLLAEQRAAHFNATFGLYEGPSFFNDGIAGYPSPPAEPDDAGSSFVLDHPGADKRMALSTNCVYVGAYRAAAQMAAELGRRRPEWNREADRLARTINLRFWMPKVGRYGYLLDPQGRLDPSQEGTGVSFAILFGIANRRQTQLVLQNVRIEPYGIADVAPPFPRFSIAKPGRHNTIVWPIVEGMWARAAVAARSASRFGWETENLARLAADGHFFEIYDAETGRPNGGWQNGNLTDSQPDQTWSATAYLSMIFNGMFGMRFEQAGLSFAPLVRDAWGPATLSDLPYRQAVLSIRLTGSGSRLRQMTLDGRPARIVPSTLTGRHKITLEVEP